MTPGSGQDATVGLRSDQSWRVLTERGARKASSALHPSWVTRSLKCCSHRVRAAAAVFLAAALVGLGTVLVVSSGTLA